VKSRAKITVCLSGLRPFVYVVYYVHVHYEYHDQSNAAWVSWGMGYR